MKNNIRRVWIARIRIQRFYTKRREHDCGWRKLLDVTCNALGDAKRIHVTLELVVGARVTEIDSRADRQCIIRKVCSSNSQIQTTFAVDEEEELCDERIGIGQESEDVERQFRDAVGITECEDIVVEPMRRMDEGIHDG